MRKNDKRALAAPKRKRQNEYSMHGLSFKEWCATPGIELWIKVFFYIVTWYVRHPKKVFFCSYKKISDDLRKCGCRCTIRGIEEAIRILKTDVSNELQYYPSGKKVKDGVGLIKVVYNEEITEDGNTRIIHKGEYTKAGNNPNHYIFRKIYLNYPRLHKFISIFSGENHIVKKLRPKSRYKKLINKRPMSYTKKILPAFKRQMRESLIEKYKTPNQMFYGFLFTYSSKYYDVTRLIKNYIPEHAINLQKEQDQEEWLNFLEVNLRGSPFDFTPSDTSSLNLAKELMEQMK